MKESRIITASLLSTALLCFSTTSAQQQFLPNSPSSQTLSRELEPPFPNTFQTNNRFLPQENPRPPIPSARQTIFTPNNRFGPPTYQNSASTNPRPAVPPPPVFQTFSTFRSSFVNFQTSSPFASPSDVPSRQLNPAAPSSQQRLFGNIDRSASTGQAAPSFAVINSPSPASPGTQRETVRVRQGTPSISGSSVTFSSNDGRSFSYSSNVSDGPSRPAVELVPPQFKERSSPTIPPNFRPVFADPGPTPSRQNRFADVGTITSPVYGEVNSPTLSPPVRSSAASARALNNLLPFGQTNRIPQTEFSRNFFNPAVNSLPLSAESGANFPPNRPALPVELLPPAVTQYAQTVRTEPIHSLTKIQSTPPAQANLVDQSGKAPSFRTNLFNQNLPNFPSVSNHVPVSTPQPAVDLPRLSDLRLESIQTIQPIIQDIITASDRTATVSKGVPATPTSSPDLQLNLQPPLLSPATIPSPPFSSDSNQSREKSPQPAKDQLTSIGTTSMSAPVTSALSSSKPNESSPDEILSTVITFSTPLPSTPSNQPPSNSAPLPSNPPSTSPTSPSLENIQAAIPIKRPLVLDLEPPEDNVESPPQPQKEINVPVPPPASEGFVIFQTPQSTANKSASLTTLTITNKGEVGVIKPQESSKPAVSSDFVPLADPKTASLTPRAGIAVPQIEQGSIFPASLNQRLPLSADSPRASPTILPGDQQQSAFKSPETPPSTTSGKATSESAGLSTDLLPPLSGNGVVGNNDSSNPFLPLVNGTSVSSPVSPFNFTTKFIADVTFSASHGPGSPCVRLDLQHKGYRAPQVGGNLLLSPGYYPTDATNDTANQCGKPDGIDGRRFNWWQILLNNGGEPSALTAPSGSDTQVPILKNPCIRPFETEGVPVYYNHTSSDLKTFYREEVAYHRFPGKSHTFLESRGLLVWRQAKSADDTTAYIVEYTRDDTGFWLQVRRADCRFETTLRPSLNCDSVSDCACSIGANKTCPSTTSILAKDLTDVEKP